MSLLIQDTARNNLVTWAANAHSEGLCAGAVLSPFTTPTAGNGYKQSAARIAERLNDAGVPVWLDPTTHALQMAGVGDFRYYDTWDLWSATPGALSSAGDRRDHIRRVFALQDEVGAPHLSPAILLHAGQSQTSERALSLSQISVEEDPEAWLAIAGDTHFWSSNDLDAHIGAMAQLQPAGWFLTVVRPQSVLPVQTNAAEVYGLMRTTRSLSDYATVHVSHGDLAALPAIAAGASTVGTGWDVRQRVCAYSDYALRSSDVDGGSWYQRPTLRGLLGSLIGNEFVVLQGQNAELAFQLLPGSLPPGPEAAFTQHATVLNDVISDLRGRNSSEACHVLRDMYETAKVGWTAVQAQTGCTASADEWIDPLLTGLRSYMEDEGW